MSPVTEKNALLESAVLGLPRHFLLSASDVFDQLYKRRPPPPSFCDEPLLMSYFFLNEDATQKMVADQVNRVFL